MANEEQKEYWSGAKAESWVRSQNFIDRTLAPITRRLLEAVDPQPGQRVLDVGCGCGETTLLLGERLPHGHVLGVDLSEGMLAHAASRRTAPTHHVRFECGDASCFPFDAPFDRIVSRFGVMFFDDPPAAFAHLRRNLAPGGRLVFVCWRTLEENDWMRVAYDAVTQHVPVPVLPGPGQPGPHAFGPRDALESTLSAAGFQNPALEPVDVTLRMQAPLEEIVEFFSHSSASGRALKQAPDEASRGQARAALGEVLAGLHDGSGVALDAGVWLADCRD